ncbi:2-oxoglutarate dehydrogenase E1 component [Candidatus Kinetoplastidibacterium crithidiae]|uniref:2-oxoglutarate dehydrogenase E1 component n=1 Tax=Candidatus Kinetoplastidibacterium crithidiae TCC036E TaxID=1208918 RepID=M1L4Y2_9PROT|nr:2-oxoglutarate dehydrogenase E1 component [Candidatus Kinetoplastibacterium crithidii]AFZ82616.1 oxoglutarate dehydrogenase (succinyl-transferring), E1 component [Candidatus Kinetoplastibacterium crithidii (ex Angomonas deanei ATCC 30255)]AGF47723.1 2-oxoglutarate dehydrogenase E1 component [Candidatus Kinetoplastibacterium crithidii TCC036E]
MSSNKESLSTSYLFGGNAPYVEELYEIYLDNPGAVAEHWRQYFDHLQNSPATDGSEKTVDQAHAPIVESFAYRAKTNSFVNNSPKSSDLSVASKQVFVQSIIAAYRSLGVHWADLDPLKRKERSDIPELDPAFYGFIESDLDQTYSSSSTYFSKSSTMTLREILKSLRDTYCRSIGVEFMHISNPVIKRWIQERMESTQGVDINLGVDGKRHILQQLTEAEGLERFLHTKYVGQKRFSLEGGESFIASMDEVVNHAADLGIQEVIVGMAHRGRLNMLVNIMGKMPGDLFAEFEGKHSQFLSDGDVKYHNGFSSDLATRSGPVHLSLAFNPSHLEIVNPVVEGSARARQERREDHKGKQQVLPVLVHGDSAFAGQGVVMETLNLALTRGYGTGGTIHIVINNQIGFTTSDPRDARSTIYCTDVVKMIEAPVFHVNGDDPEAVVFASRLAVDYRMQFGRDVVIDIVCFRKLGHNEQDTPALTQPLMYSRIKQHPGTRKFYADKLIDQKVLTSEEADNFVKEYRQVMEDGHRTIEPILTDYKSKYAIDWAPFLNSKWTDHADTAVPISELNRIGELITKVPDGFNAHPLVAKLLNDRRKMSHGEINLDYGMAEHLAFATLLNSGYAIRITGQDSGRGTFTHRHAVLHDQNREKWDDGVYVPLKNISDSQAPFVVIDSVLSEEAVLGFEYGYSCSEPNTLTIWEAQFGDFVNGAQVVIDQFISSGEAKWGRQSGLTMMLPHGYEGQGPEHSSGRIERFLQLCSDNNMQVVQPTAASQIFHLLRRQMIRPFRKPLVIFTPKSLLRNKDASSPLLDLSEGSFKMVIPEVDANINPKSVKRLLACSGKVYYDLVNSRKERSLDNVAIIRVEQLYPFAHKSFEAELQKYPNLSEIIWVQDEPQNQGPWYYIQHHLYENMKEGQKLGYAGRTASASPAVGYLAKHQEQQKNLVDQAFAQKFKVILAK